ncbi:MAG: hypothetical protein KDA93_16650 [Planctomycetaceae bacterium]|nr:hypothetical protein [Planctomycetaceae bacterium]
MPLFLPDSYSHNSRHPVLSVVKQYYSFSAITDSTVHASDVVKELSSVPMVDALRWICTISSLITSPDGKSSQVQRRWAYDLFPEEWSERIDKQMSDDSQEPGLIFHRRSIWLVLQLAMLSCRKESSSESGVESSKHVARACFMANDLVTEIEAEAEAALSRSDVTEWMVGALVPTIGIEGGIDFEAIGRAFHLWEYSVSSPEFTNALATRRLPSFESAFTEKYGVPLGEFLRFCVTLYIRFFGTFLSSPTNPLLLEVATDEALMKFDDKVRGVSLELISQSCEELTIKLMRSRHLWPSDVTPLRERPLIEVERGKYCCPDLGLLTRSCIERVFFLLQDAYPPSRFREVFGSLFEAYVNWLLSKVVTVTGKGRILLEAPTFVGTADQAADGILYWVESAAVMEYKAGLLTTRQRYAGIPDELLKGIESKVATEKKGISQLAKNIARMISGENVQVESETFDLSSCRVFYPILVCFDESLGIHAVTKLLQRRLDAELEKRQVPSDRVGPLMLLSIHDFENFVTAGASLSMEHILREYGAHLRSQPRDYTATFSGVLSHKFGSQIDWEKSVPHLAHQELIKELTIRLGDVPKE